jgi:hypothetical protein
MARSLTRRLVLIATVPLLVVALGGCSAIGRAVIDQFGGDSRSGDGGYGEDLVTHDDGDTDIYSLVRGECIDEPEFLGADLYASVDVVDCEQPHIAEFYSHFDVPGDEYPGDEEVWDSAEIGCSAEFGVYVGTSWEESRYDYMYFGPDETNWAVGDHEVMCFIVDYEQEFTSGSARNGAI